MVPIGLSITTSTVRPTQSSSFSWGSTTPRFGGASDVLRPAEHVYIPGRKCFGEFEELVCLAHCFRGYDNAMGGELAAQDPRMSGEFPQLL